MAEQSRYAASAAATGGQAGGEASIQTRVPRAWQRRDTAALIVLASLPVLMFVLPAAAGQPVMAGDDAIQNFPLRVLAGSYLRHGHLPVFDPYLWSGAPLLGGWNAGAAYPLTLLFAVLPGAAAWTLNMAATWWVAGLGSFAFLRASRLSSAASFLGALSYAFAGAMTAQFPHFGLVAGMSWVPLALLAALRLAQRPSLRARLGWISVLAAAVALVILAGEPRAIDDAAILVGCYAGWRAWRLRQGRAALAYAAAVLAGAVIGVAIGAVQWLPGIEAVGSSQRAVPSAALFALGSLPPKWLLLGLVPNLLGGSGSFGEPVFRPAHTLTEVTSYAGLMPLAAACDLLRRLPQLARQQLPEWVIWMLLGLVGVLLALGGHTPLGAVLFHVPFFGDQRLQSRNIMITDFALAVLFAYWADLWLREPGPGARPDAPARRVAGAARRVVSAAPGLAAAGLAVAAAVAGERMWHWLGAGQASAGAAMLRPWLFPFGLLGCLAAGLAWWGPRLRPALRARLLICFVCADVTVFTLLSVASVASAPGGARPSAVAAASAIRGPVAGVRALLGRGRFAVYDPGLIDEQQLRAIGAPDRNVMPGAPSVEGYGSLVNAAYAAATGSHTAAGNGQYVLSPRAIGNGTLDQLGTTVLLTAPDYLLTPLTAGRAAAPARPGPGTRSLSPRQLATWYFAASLPVASVTVPVRAAQAGDGRGIRIGVLLPSGRADWRAAARASAGSLSASFSPPRPGVAIEVTAARRRMTLGPPVITAADGARYRADGRLQAALVPPRWRFSGLDGAFGIFRDVMAWPPLTLRPLPHESTAGAAVRAAAGPPSEPAAARVSSPHGVTVVRSAAAIPGWSASWQPADGGPARLLPVHRSGLIQAVQVPPGRGTVTWSYRPPGGRLAGWLSLPGLALLAGAAIGAAAPARRRRRGSTIVLRLNRLGPGSTRGVRRRPHSKPVHPAAPTKGWPR